VEFEATVPTVKDRIVQTAVKLVLEPIFEATFCPTSYGFRPGRGCRDALREVDHLIKEGHTFVVDADLQSYFDTIPHERLMQRVEERISDGRILALLRGWLGQDIMRDIERWTPTQGTPQGAVISPLLANIYLHPLDELMAARGYRMVRYADDCVPRTHRRKEVRNCVRDGGRSSGAGRQGQAPNHRKLRRSKAGVVSVAEKAGLDPVRCGSERRARANR
jgi:RNA-directed DNA polymerase